MKKAFILPLVIVLIFSSQLQAQQMIPVMDNLLKESLDDHMKTNLKQSALLEAIREETEDTKENVEATEYLQYNYREFLKQTTSTAALMLSEAGQEQLVTGQVVSSSNHLDDYTFAAQLDELYHEQTEPIEKSQILHDMLVPYNEHVIFTQLAPFEAYQKEKSLHVIALKEMSQRRKLQLAIAWQLLAQTKTEQAEELRTLLNTDQIFSMTEAERLEMISRMQDHLLEAKQLKAKADELIKKASTPSFQKQQVVNAYKLKQERESLSETPLY
ncbi:hypothetical protein [Catalinimonas niigatensis]|uniref:hypothetical protein n=1 Tax=Catalinimonas niigatensis TaxID=1397264 RepID=UPI0026651D90|nr:hypothetical protein [Catalinimonas niigatensis]WPP51846.1 hypothetical protein PZB72_05525 [Catalinimonas niigatensis]